MESEYAYASGDLLAERNEYSYTPYEGIGFLRAWERSRSQAAAALPPALPPPPGDAAQPAAAAGGVETADVLEGLYGRIGAAGLAAAEAATLAAFVKKFETTKRVHRAYHADMRAVDPSAHRDLSLYVRLAEVFDHAYAALGGLPYLNALLKCIDTLVSQAPSLTPGDGGRLAGLIVREREHVVRLAGGKGVRW